MLEKLVEQLKESLNMQEEITPSGKGGYNLAFAGDLSVALKKGERSFFLKAIVGQLPSTEQETILSKAMEANLFGSGTRGGSLGLDAEEKMLTLTMELDYNAPFQTFYERLEDCVSVCHFWRQELKLSL